MMKKLTFVLFSTLLWLIAAALCLEAWALWREHRLRQGNPFILADINSESSAWLFAVAQNKKGEDAGALPLAPDFHPGQVPDLLHHRLHGPAFPEPSLEAWQTPVVNEPPERKEQRWRQFPALSETDRQYFALVHSEMVFSLDGNADLLRVYGLFTLREKITTTVAGRARWKRFEELDANIIAAAGKALKAPPGITHARLSLDMRLGYAPDIAVMTSASAPGESIFVFMKIDFDRLIETQPLDENSPWITPFYRYKPNLMHGYSGLNEEFFTNNLGFRDYDVAMPKPPGLLRILCIGGSTTEEGGSLDTTWPNLLERALCESFPDCPIEVINCGIAGMSTATHLGRLPEYLEMDPDLLILYEGVNDFTRELPTLWQQQSLWVNLATFSRFFRRYLLPVVIPDETEMVGQIQQFSLRNLESIRRAAAYKNIPVIFCGIAYPDPDVLISLETDYLDFNARNRWDRRTLTFPVYVQQVALFNDLLRNACQTSGAGFIPLHPYFRAGITTFSDICHMHAPGTEKKARIIHRHLMEMMPPCP